jgi:hypothetical protein
VNIFRKRFAYLFEKSFWNQRPLLGGNAMTTLIAPSFEKLIVPGAKIDPIASGFEFTEGPVWNSEKQNLVLAKSCLQ